MGVYSRMESTLCFNASTSYKTPRSCIGCSFHLQRSCSGPSQSCAAPSGYTGLKQQFRLQPRKQGQASCWGFRGKWRPSLEMLFEANRQDTGNPMAVLIHEMLDYAAQTWMITNLASRFTIGLNVPSHSPGSQPCTVFLRASRACRRAAHCTAEHIIAR